jgi:hypothetical protein
MYHIFSIKNKSDMERFLFENPNFKSRLHQIKRPQAFEMPMSIYVVFDNETDFDGFVDFLEKTPTNKLNSLLEKEFMKPFKE